MISWIVASQRPDILDEHLRPTIPPGDQLVVVEDAPSIAAAYNEGQRLAYNPVRVYVHQDVRLTDPERLRHELVQWVGLAGIVGVVGCWNRAVPYWTGALAGSVLDSRGGVTGPGKGGQVAYLDGLLLATVRDWTWDESYPGWHGYDHDICEQSLRLGLPNWCLTDGHLMVEHHTTSSFDPPGFPDAMTRFREKWGV